MALIPDELRQAHEDGEVVFFCGAGVSMPAGLPSFKGLVKQVLEALCPARRKLPIPWAAFGEDRFDEALDFLERSTGGGYGKEVRQCVRDILKSGEEQPRPNIEPHVTLCRLAELDGGRGKLVTTNFDSLFERGLRRLLRKSGSKQRIIPEIAPALSPPKPLGWHGLVHLHGKLDQDPDNKNLVLTTADFGKAYLLDGWARRVVIDLFRHFHVVFIGYSIEDPTMRYLVSALAAARESKEGFRDAYAFAPYGGQDEPDTTEEAVAAWSVKGVTPIPYKSTGDHEELWTSLKQWADDHSGGLDSKFQKVTLYARTRPADAPDEAIDELVWALKDSSVAKGIPDLDKRVRLNPAWVSVLQEKGLLSCSIGEDSTGNEVCSPLVSYLLPDHLRLHDTTSHLARWIASCLDSMDPLEWAISNGGVLHGDLRFFVRQELKKREDIPSGIRKIWQVLASDEYAHALSVKAKRVSYDFPKLSTDDPGIVQAFLNCLQPIPVFMPKRRIFDRGRERNLADPVSCSTIEIHLVGFDSDHEIEQVRKQAENWQDVLASIAEDITTLLRAAMDWQKHFNLANEGRDRTYIEYRSISPHPQNDYTKAWTQLIELARDSLDELAARDDDAATRLVRRWQCIQYPVFRRLVLYAASGGKRG